MALCSCSEKGLRGNPRRGAVNIGARQPVLERFLLEPLHGGVGQLESGELGVEAVKGATRQICSGLKCGGARQSLRTEVGGRSKKHQEGTD
jgi:hypothetical protein